MALRLKLKRSDEAPLYRQVDGAIRAAIEGGRLKPGDRLPSVVDLADDLGIHKLTVLKAFRALEGAGLLESHVGRGTFVRVPGSRPATDGVGPTSEARPSEARPEVARALTRLRDGYARGLRDLMNVARPPGTLDLGGGVPSPDTIPEGLLERLSQKVLAKGARRLYAYGGPAGLPELRVAIARALSLHGTTVSPDEVIVTNGSQQAIGLVAAWARDEGRSALVETPSFTGVAGAFTLFGHSVQSVPWVGPSLDLADLRAAAAGRRSLAYVCPDFHNPTGQTLSEDARRALAAWALETDGGVLDDQIIRDMRVEGEEPPSLYSLLPAGRRFLVGSVSKSFMTGLRVGFLVADAPVVAELLPSKRHMDLGGPALVQAIAAAFLEDGYADHLEKMRGYYRARRDAALEALEASMPDGVTWTRPEGGFQLWVTMPRGCSSIRLFLRGLERGVAIVPGPAHDPDGRYLHSFRLGYGHGTPAQVRDGVKRLAEIVKDLVARGPDESVAGGPGIVV